jgi:hypothetical protein
MATATTFSCSEVGRGAQNLLYTTHEHQNEANPSSLAAHNIVIDEAVVIEAPEPHAVAPLLHGVVADEQAFRRRLVLAAVEDAEMLAERERVVEQQVLGRRCR